MCEKGSPDLLLSVVLDIVSALVNGPEVNWLDNIFCCAGRLVCSAPLTSAAGATLPTFMVGVFVDWVVDLIQVSRM